MQLYLCKYGGKLLFLQKIIRRMVFLVICVFVGSGLGGVIRFVVGELLKGVVSGSSLPVATFIVNIIGCFIIGIITGMVAHGVNISPAWRTGLTVGFCGGLTTFSTFGRETLELLQSGQIGMALCYVALSLVVGIAAAWSGMALSSRLSL